MSTTATSTLRKSSFAPKYVGLAQTLLRQIARDGMAPGDRLGTEIELGQKHGVSRVTVRQALALLESEGFISRHKARGTFVNRAIAQAQQLTLVRGSVLVVCSNEQAAHMEEDFAFATVLRRMERTLAKQGFSVQILGVGEDKAADKARLEHLAQREDLEGVCTIGSCLEPYRDIFRDTPIISSCCFYSEAPPLVRQDVMQVSRECVGHLLANGHRDVALLCGPWIDQKAFAIFAEGYRQAFEAVDARFQRSLLYHAYPGEPLENFVSSVLQSSPRPTAVFADNWRVCQAVLAAARQIGARIPDDLSLVAYGQNVLQVASPVPITTYVPDSEQIGELAAGLLSRIIDGEAPPDEPISVPGRLIIGGSVRAWDVAGAGKGRE